MNVDRHIRDFGELAHRCLERLARSVGVVCRPGHYQEVFAEVRRTSRKGRLRDASGPLEYRFHGAGCEFVSSDYTLDFNVFPMIGGVSPIAFGAFDFTKFLVSRGEDCEEADVLRLLRSSSGKQQLRKQEGRDYFFMMVG